MAIAYPFVGRRHSYAVPQRTEVIHYMSRSSTTTREVTDGMITLGESDRHRVLSATTRRATLDVLAARSTPIELEDVAEALVRRESDRDSVSTDVDRLAVTLHHHHLPMMAELGIVEYNQEATRIEAVRWVPDS